MGRAGGGRGPGEQGPGCELSYTGCTLPASARRPFVENGLLLREGLCLSRVGNVLVIAGPQPLGANRSSGGDLCPLPVAGPFPAGTVGMAAPTSILGAGSRLT